MKRLFVFILLIFTAAICNAKIKNIVISGVTSYSGINNTIDSPAIQIYGGTGGSSSAGGCASKDGTSPCNSCATESGICNKARIYDSLLLNISFSETEAFIGTPRITIKIAGAVTDTAIGNPGTPVITATPNLSQNVSVRWGDLCAQAGPSAATGAGSTCDGDGTTTLPTTTFTLQVGMDKDSNGKFESTDDFVTMTVNLRSPDTATYKQTTSASCTGLCHFSLYPGDDKAYVTGSVTNASNTSKAHYYCSTTSFSAISTVSPEIDFEMDVANSTSLSADTITGLSNDTKYYCRTAVEDSGGNIGLFTTDGTLDATSTCDETTYAGECHTVTPSPVVGLFDKKNCFIATAAYGSPLHPFVKTLQMFRGKYLMPFAWGRSFVYWYYKTGPQWAQWIAQSEVRLLGARILLLPIILLAYSIMYWPWTLFLIGCIYFFYSQRQRRIAA